MAVQRPTVSLIVPTLNEAQNLPLVFPFLPREWIDEVILVDGRSTDDTVATALQLCPDVKIVLEPRRGKGAALRAGYRVASGEVLVVIDADGSHDPREIPRFVQALMEGSDFVKGSRFAPHGGTTDMPRYRKAGNGAFTVMSNVLFDQHWTDLCYGFHAFWRYCLDQLDLNDIDGFEIDTAIYLRAVREKLRVTEVGSFEGYRFFGVGKLKTIPDGWRVLKTIMREVLLAWQQPQPELYLGFRGLMPAAATALAAPAAGPLTEFVPPVAPPLPAGGPRSVAGLGATALQRARLSLGSLAVLDDDTLQAAGALPLMGHVLRMAMEAAGAGSGSLVLVDEHGTPLLGCAQYDGAAQAIHEGGRTELVERGLAGWVVRHRAPALVASTREDPRWLRRAWDEHHADTRSALGVPVLLGDRLLGILTLVRRGQPFTEADLVTVANLARLH